MKIWITGPQGTLKKETSRLLEQETDMKAAMLFTGLAQDEITYNKEMYKTYDVHTIRSIFENGAYIFMHDTFEKTETQEGLEFDEFDSSDIFILSIDQFLSINVDYISKGDLIVWLDGSKEWRMVNCDEGYDMRSREKAEEALWYDFANMLLSLQSSHHNVVYFNNEYPERVACIVKLINDNPSLRNTIIKSFKA